MLSYRLLLAFSYDMCRLCVMIFNCRQPVTSRGTRLIRPSCGADRSPKSQSATLTLMPQQPFVLRPGNPTFEEGVACARFFDMAAESFFRLLLNQYMRRIESAQCAPLFPDLPLPKTESLG